MMPPRTQSRAGRLAHRRWIASQEDSGLRVGLFVVVAARAAGEEQNFLSVFARHVFSYGFVPIVRKSRNRSATK
jgi:hypothetical protein